MALVGRDHDRHPVPLHVRMRTLGGAELLHFREETIEHGAAELHVRHLAAAEADRGLDLVAVLQEADDVVLLEIEVMLVDAGAELHLLDDDHLLLLLRLAGLLLLLEDELSVVHDLAHRRVRRRGDLHEVEVFLSRHLLGLCDRHDADLPSLVVDQTDFGGANELVDAVFGLYGSTVESRSSSWRVNTELPPI